MLSKEEQMYLCTGNIYTSLSDEQRENQSFFQQHSSILHPDVYQTRLSSIERVASPDDMFQILFEQIPPFFSIAKDKR